MCVWKEEGLPINSQIVEYLSIQDYRSTCTHFPLSNFPAPPLKLLSMSSMKTHFQLSPQDNKIPSQTDSHRSPQSAQRTRPRDLLHVQTPLICAWRVDWMEGRVLEMRKKKFDLRGISLLSTTSFPVLDHPFSPFTSGHSSDYPARKRRS